MPERMTWQQRYAAMADIEALKTLLESEWFMNAMNGPFTEVMWDLHDERKADRDRENWLMFEEAKLKMNPDVPRDEKVRIAMSGLSEEDIEGLESMRP